MERTAVDGRAWKRASGADGARPMACRQSWAHGRPSLHATPWRPPPFAGADVTHVVQRGHTIEAIAHRYHVTVKAIVDANHLKDPAHLKPGQTLIIPGVDGPKEEGRQGRTPKPEFAARRRGSGESSTRELRAPSASASADRGPPRPPPEPRGRASRTTPSTPCALGEELPDPHEAIAPTGTSRRAPCSKPSSAHDAARERVAHGRSTARGPRGHRLEPLQRKDARDRQRIQSLHADPIHAALEPQPRASARLPCSWRDQRSLARLLPNAPKRGMRVLPQQHVRAPRCARHQGLLGRLVASRGATQVRQAGRSGRRGHERRPVNRQSGSLPGRRADCPMPTEPLRRKPKRSSGALRRRRVHCSASGSFEDYIREESKKLAHRLAREAGCRPSSR